MSFEIAKLRRELAEIGGAFSQSEKYREDAHSQLAVIVDEAFGPQEVLPLPNLLSRLERLLTERARQHEEVRRELTEAKAEIAKLRSELELEKKKRAADWRLIGDGHDRLDRVEKSRDLIVRQRDLIERERDEARAHCRAAAQVLIAEISASGPENIEETARRAVAAIQSERGQRKSDLLQDLAEVLVALRNLVVSVDRSGSRDTAVLCDLDAARAVLGEDGS